MQKRRFCTSLSWRVCCFQARFPKKSCEFVLNLLRNAESNAEYKGLETDSLIVKTIQVYILLPTFATLSKSANMVPLHLTTCVTWTLLYAKLFLLLEAIEVFK